MLQGKVPSRGEQEMESTRADYTQDKIGPVPAICAGCRRPITDQYILRVAPNLEWHASCLKCDDCNSYLDETCTCFIRDGKPYCKKDFVRRFGAKCQRCSQGFATNDFVMRVRENIFHLGCFRCNMCSRQLLPGEEFALLPEGLICGVHIKQPEPVLSQPLTITQDRPQCRSSQMPKSTSHVSSSTGESKTTRVRTVLNDRQLRILRTCYNNNPRPDALMKEQMTKLTGLSARVIRVWFQNKRCKDKKKAIAAASSEDVISSSVIDSPSENEKAIPGVDTSFEAQLQKEFSPIDCTQADFNSSSESTSPSLSTSGENYGLYDTSKDFSQASDRAVWTSSDFIPAFPAAQVYNPDSSGIPDSSQL